MITNEERLLILENAEDQAYAALSRISEDNYDAKAFMDTLTGLHDLIAMRAVLEERPTYVTGICTETDGDTPAPIAEPTTTPAETPAPAAEPTPVPEEETISKEDLRGKLSDLRSKHGVNVSAIIQDLGYSRLNEVPSGKYAELLRIAEEAAKESA